MLINLNVSIVNNIVSRQHLGYKGVHLNSYGSSRLAMNLISIIKKCEMMLAIQHILLNINLLESKITSPNANIYSCLEQSSTDNISFIDENEESNETHLGLTN